MQHWIYDSIFYHIYVLGFCGAPLVNDFTIEMEERLLKIINWLPHLKELGITALYLGPLFESETHGYDTIDYYQVDKRLGNDQTLKQVISACHETGIKVILDGVFNHVSRNFPAFQDLIINQQDSMYKDWFYKLNFNQTSSYGDPFSYHCWDGHYNLVKLNLNNSAVKEHLFGAVKKWITQYDIDGLRLDAADVLDKTFMQDLKQFTNNLKKDFWLMGEVVHGDYNYWANDNLLDSTTNYECFKGLYSSHNDENYFEIAYSLRRQFSEDGIYNKLHLYNFVDNHDVNRVASLLSNQKHLYPLYGLLFAMPGIPSIYYGSEFGIKGQKKDGSDAKLRPELDLKTLIKNPPHPDLIHAIKKFINCRKEQAALKYGDYKEIHVDHKLLVFQRKWKNEIIITVINAAEKEIKYELPLEISIKSNFDVLNQEELPLEKNKLKFMIHPNWLRIIKITI